MITQLPDMEIWKLNDPNSGFGPKEWKVNHAKEQMSNQVSMYVLYTHMMHDVNRYMDMNGINICIAVMGPYQL